MRFKNKKQLVKLIIGAGAALALFFIVAIIALWVFFPKEHFRLAAAQQLSERLNQDVTIEDVSLGFYPDVELVVKGVRIRDRQTAEEIASAQRIRLDVSFFRLLRGQMALEDIVVNSPELRLVRAPDGTWNAQRALETIKNGKSDGGNLSTSRMSPIRIRRGMIKISDDAAPYQLAIENIDAVYNVENRVLYLNSALLTLPFLTAQCTGKISEIGSTDPLLVIDAKVSLTKDGPLARLRKDSELPAHAPVADMSLKISGRSRNIDLRSDFSLNPAITDGVATAGNFAGQLQAPDGLLKISAFDASVGKSAISAAGDFSNIWSEAREGRVGGKGKFVLEEMSGIIGWDRSTSFEPAGVVAADFDVQGHTKQIDITTNLDLFDAGLTIPRVMRKEPGTPGWLKIDAQYVPPKEIIIEDFQFTVGEAKVEGQGVVSPVSEPWLKGSLEAVNFPLKTLDRLQQVDFPDGNLMFSAQVQKSTPASPLAVEGNGTIENAVLLTEILDEPVRDLHASVAVKENGAIVDAASFSLASSLFHVKGEIKDFDNPQIRGSVRTPLLNINEITSAIKKKADPPASSVDTVKKPGLTLSLFIEADSLYAGTIMTGPVTTTWSMENNVHIFEPTVISSFGGEIEGSLQLEASGGELAWSTKFEGRQLKLDQLAEQFHPEKTRVTGSLFASGELSGSGGAGEEVWNSIDGHLLVRADKGEIKQYAMLKNIFLLMQLPLGIAWVPVVREIAIINTLVDAARTRGRSLDPSHITYDQMAGAFSIVQGVARTDDFRMESGIADLLFQGDLHLSRKHMDMTVRAMPLGSLGSLAGMIPIAGAEIRKAKESLISTDFTVRGQWADPQVRLAAAEKILGNGSK